MNDLLWKYFWNLQDLWRKGFTPGLSSWKKVEEVIQTQVDSRKLINDLDHFDIDGFESTAPSNHNHLEKHLRL